MTTHNPADPLGPSATPREVARALVIVHFTFRALVWLAMLGYVGWKLFEYNQLLENAKNPTDPIGLAMMLLVRVITAYVLARGVDALLRIDRDRKRALS